MPDISAIPPAWGLGGGILVILAFVLYVGARVIFQLVPPLVKTVVTSSESAARVLDTVNRISSSQMRGDSTQERLGEMLVALTNTVIRHEEREAERHKQQTRLNETQFRALTEQMQGFREDMMRELGRPLVRKDE